MEKEEIFIFGHKSPDTDTICSSLVKERLSKKEGCKNVVAKRLGNVNKETQFVLNYLKIDAPELLEKVEEGQKVALVDHSAFSQSVDGIEKAKILSVTDHHRVSDFETAEPLYVTVRPYGCTSTILYEEYKMEGHTIDKEEATLMLSAIVSDTLLFKSPTCTEKDINAAKELANIANVDVNTYGMEMLKAGTDLSDLTSEEIIEMDTKPLESKGVKMQVSQVNTASFDDILKNKKDLERAISEYIEKNNIDLFLLTIVDIINSNAEAIVLGKRIDIFEKAFKVKLEDNMAFLPGVVSRKKQIFPVLLENV